MKWTRYERHPKTWNSCSHQFHSHFTNPTISGEHKILCRIHTFNSKRIELWIQQKKYTQIQFIWAQHLLKFREENFCFISNFPIIPWCSNCEVWYLIGRSKKAIKWKKGEIYVILCLTWVFYSIFLFGYCCKQIFASQGIMSSWGGIRAGENGIKE